MLTWVALWLRLGWAFVAWELEARANAWRVEFAIWREGHR